VENPGVVSFVVVGFPTSIYHLNKILKTKTNETTSGFPTNIYHLNKIQNTTTNETTPYMFVGNPGILSFVFVFC
jgi:hypothetical protein